MKLFHTADWHLGKLVQGVYMTEDQEYILRQFIEAIKMEKPDAVIIAGDLYDRAVPPTEAVLLLNEILEEIVIKLKTPVLAIAGNHDSPSRLNFGSKIMRSVGFHIVGEFAYPFEPVVLGDEFGEVHFHLVPYAEPGKVRHVLLDESIKTHDDAMRVIVEKINEQKDDNARHVLIGHAFVTHKGEEKENTSTSERPLSIGGAEHVSDQHLKNFHYVALGHLHQAHHTGIETIRYSGSPLKYSSSEATHKKGYLVVELDEEGNATVEKRFLEPRRDMYIVEGFMDEIEKQQGNEDYVFVRLLDDAPVLTPMERVRAVYPNAMHVERVGTQTKIGIDGEEYVQKDRTKMDDISLFKAFYKEVKGLDVSEQTEGLFKDTLEKLLQLEGERK
ncbi:exonuclease SbcCD subunit D [Bacillus suaedaesalsae]|uniref:Nuclease SbcCD subunit D n=1 Tax=Bacillus suaedaesalsae TaxID=2810349 RepID=A0ABS2DM01_9BACI|nr:exonuclease SbcCD subunit D [Bacillus suaedaesalsae]MBM6619488.1 exonuclease SbcCD subunit D [Bacillus suaedaesalsae]